MRRIVVPLMVLGALIIGPVPFGAEAQVRSPRDGQVIIHGHMMPPQPFDSTRITPPHSQPGFTLHPPPPASIGVDPGYRPLWVPGTNVWNGFSSTYVPGHYIWQAP